MPSPKMPARFSRRLRLPCVDPLARSSQPFPIARSLPKLTIFTILPVPWIVARVACKKNRRYRRVFGLRIILNGRVGPERGCDWPNFFDVTSLK